MKAIFKKPEIINFYRAAVSAIQAGFSNSI